MITRGWANISAVDQKQYSVVIFLDLRKAFAVIDHRVLLNRLRKYGFGEVETNDGKWIAPNHKKGQQDQNLFE